MTRKERYTLAVVAVVFILLAPLALLVGRNGGDLPNVIVCLNEGGPNVPGGPGTLTLEVDISENRPGHIVEREFLGCTFYWYTLPFR